MFRARSIVIAMCLALLPLVAHADRDDDDAAIEIEADDTSLSISFPEPMRAIDNMLVHAVSIQPHRPLICRWDDDITVECRIDGEEFLPAATTIMVDIAPGLFTAEGQPIDAQRLTVETDRPNLMASISGWKAGIPAIVLNANMSMALEDAARALELRSGGRVWRDLRLTAIPTEYEEWEREAPRFALNLPSDLPEDAVVELWLRKGLVATAGPLRGSEDRRIVAFRYAEPFRVRGMGCAQRSGLAHDWNTDDGLALDCVAGESVHLYLSGELTLDARKTIATLLPAGVRIARWDSGYEWRRQQNDIQTVDGQSIELQAPQSGSTIAFEIGDTLTDTFGRRLQATMPVTLRNGLPKPSLRAAASQLLVNDPRVAQVMAVNSKPTGIVVSGVGKAAVSEQIDSPASREAMTMFTSQATQRVLAEGGWVRWRPSNGGAMHMAAPQFDLSAQIGTRSIVAWAMDWDDSRPIANAEVVLSLVGGNEGDRVVVRGRTDRDGLARLNLPRDFVLPVRKKGAIAPEWVLRAQTDTRLAVLSLGDIDDYRFHLGRERSPTRVFAVADRPLYRAGDTVRYRGWARTLRGGRLLAVGENAIEFGMVSAYEERTFQTWMITPSADGGFVGELALPVHLVDGDYCIRPTDDDSIENNGVCFFVGTFRAQDLWVEADTSTPLLRPGGTFEATVSAGYWSGGGASGVGVQRVAARLIPESPAAAYPQYADYRFVASDDDENGYSLQYNIDEFPKLDAEGRAKIAIPIAFEDEAIKAGAPPPFGRIEMTAEAGLAGREAVASNKAIARYAHFQRYVGLRVQPSWFDARTPLRLHSVVIDAAGTAQAGAKVEVVAEYLPESDGVDQPIPVQIATCTLMAGVETVCDVPRTRSGRYRFTARSGDAAPAVLERDVWNAADARKDATAPEPALTLIAAPATADAPMRVLLRQPYAQADALVVISAGGELLDTRVLAIDRIESELTLPTFAGGRNQVKLDMLIRSRTASVVRDDGLRTPPQTKYLSLTVDVPRRKDPAAIAIEFDAVRAKPGEARKIRVRNRGNQSRAVTLTILDDALRSLAGARWDAFDPHGDAWLGRREFAWSNTLHYIGFSGWNSSPWRINLPWDDAQKDIDDVAVTEARIPRSSDTEQTQPVLTLERRSLQNTGLHSVGDVLSNMSANDGDAPTAAAGVDAYGFTGGSGDELDRIEVLGSRIMRASELGVGDAAKVGKPEAGVARVERDRRIAEARALFRARLRQHFDDTALWLPEIRLAPGETREIEFVVPDNLTRWRAVAWSADAGEDFEMVEAVLEAGLPVEARLQAPVRVYPGDRAELVANARHTGDQAAQAETILQVAALDAEALARIALAPRGDGAMRLTIAPKDTSNDAAATENIMLSAVAAVRVGTHTDAVAQAIELASPTIETRKVQAGWLGASTLDLGAPSLPTGARDLQLSVSLLPGADALMHDWIGDLHRYPHRCWEQILSRAVAAAIALERGDDERFPDAKAAIDEALSNVAVFQGEQGDFRYFADSVQDAYEDHAANTPLTAYSVRALRLLSTLGHSVDAVALRQADEYLQKRASDTQDDTLAQQRVAFAAAGQQRPGRETTDRLWQRFDAQPLPVQVATARAMSNGDHPQAKKAIAKLLSATKRRGEARVLRATQRNDRWMSSDLREQCELIEVLRTHAAMTDAATRRALIAGLGDLYAGGYEDVDTQTGASCLIALRGLDADKNNATVRLEIDRGSQRAMLTLAPGEDAQTWSQAIDVLDGKRAVRLDPQVVGDTPASYVVEYRYREDARIADSSAIGFALQRRYAVLRDGAWVPIESDRLRDGDWVRITLMIDSGRERYFVAITDAVPGGLRPTDLALSGIAGLDLQKVSDTGAYWFMTRRLDPRSPKFYAEYLPPGRHEVHYFARVGNVGDYLAAPAVAELMYGSATRARTAAERVKIEP